MYRSETCAGHLDAYYFSAFGHLLHTFTMEPPPNFDDNSNDIILKIL